MYVNKIFFYLIFLLEDFIHLIIIYIKSIQIYIELWTHENSNRHLVFLKYYTFLIYIYVNHDLIVIYLKFDRLNFKNFHIKTF